MSVNLSVRSHQNAKWYMSGYQVEVTICREEFEFVTNCDLSK
jgi:hypothetical protein